MEPHARKATHETKEEIKKHRHRALSRDEELYNMQQTLAELGNLSKLGAIIAESATAKQPVLKKLKELGHCLSEYATKEKYDLVTKTALYAMAELLKSIIDQMKVEPKQIKLKVMRMVDPCQKLCKPLKPIIDKAIMAQEKTRSLEKNLARYRNKLTGRKELRLVTMVEDQVEQSKIKATSKFHLAQDQMKLFDQEQRNATKSFFLEYFKLQMAQHAKAIEVYSEAFQYLQDVDKNFEMRMLKMELAEEMSKVINTNDELRTSDKPSVGEILFDGDALYAHSTPINSEDEIQKDVKLRRNEMVTSSDGDVPSFNL